VVDDEPQPVGQRPEIALCTLPFGTHRWQPEHPVQRGHERECVDQVAQLEATHRRDQAGQSRPTDHRDIPRDHRQCRTCGYEIPPQQPGIEGPAGRRVDRTDATLRRGQDVQQPQRAASGEGLRRKRNRHHHLQRTGHQHQLAPVDRIDQDAPNHPDRDRRYRVRQTDSADGRRRVGQREDLQRHGKGGHLPTDRRQRRS